MNFIAPERQVTDSTEKCAKSDSGKKTGQNVRVVFYNTENLYDPNDDTLTLDNEFTSEGTKRWNPGKFSVKLSLLAKTILAIGGIDQPGLIGLCEVENGDVLRRLVNTTMLKKFRYGIIHYNSPDVRGIDVALLYRKEKFLPVTSRQIRIRFPKDTTLRTRDILYVCGLLFGSDTLHLFINHWPSKRGSAIQSESRRKYVAGVLRDCVDTILKKNPAANILIMGDLNDEPDQGSIVEVLRAKPIRQDNLPDDLINLMYDKLKNWRQGTHKFQGKWSIIDQFIVSASLISGKNGLVTSSEDAKIFNSGFLMEKETSRLGSRPFRTYAGPRYTGGFSDHLPIYVDLKKR